MRAREVRCAYSQGEAIRALYSLRRRQRGQAERLGSPCSSIRPIPRPPRPQRETCKLLPAGSGRTFEGLVTSTSREIDGAFATAFFREPTDAFFVGGDPLFGRRQ